MVVDALVRSTPTADVYQSSRGRHPSREHGEKHADAALLRPRRVAYEHQPRWGDAKEVVSLS